MRPAGYCPVCGLAGAAGGCPNRWCRRPGRGFSVAYSVGLYQGSLRRAIAGYKYHGDRHLAAVFASMVARYMAGHPTWFEEFDVVTAVPAYTGPGARRRWDPVGAVLVELAGRLGRAWSVEPGLLVKVRETPGMAGLGWAERQSVAAAHLRPALRAGRRAAVAGARVLVLDDVLTEGSTLHEAARLLRREGASDVAGLVLARPPWQAEPPVRAADPAG